MKTLEECSKSDPRFANALKLQVVILKDSDTGAALAALDKYLALRPDDKGMQSLKVKLKAVKK